MEFYAISIHSIIASLSHSSGANEQKARFRLRIPIFFASYKRLGEQNILTGSGFG